MNYNIFSPKGKLDRWTFIIYYVFLMSIYLIIGFVVFPALLIKKVNLIFPDLIFLIIDLLILFNYKKRFMDSFNNLTLSIILAVILTFDHLLIPEIFRVGAIESIKGMFAAIIFAFCIQPVIVVLFPSKKIEIDTKKEN